MRFYPETSWDRLYEMVVLRKASVPFHRSWLRSRENISDLSLLLGFVPYCVFNGAPIELGNLLKFVEADSHAKAGILAELAWQGKNPREQTAQDWIRRLCYAIWRYAD
jgi:hypothetical protein